MALAPIIVLFAFVRFSGRDDSNDRVAFPITMAHHKLPQSEAKPQQKKPVLVLRMIGIEILFCIFIEEDGLRFLEGHAVLASVG
jgi:hypothetical protein